jgi:hypothetical protein
LEEGNNKNKNVASGISEQQEENSKLMVGVNPPLYETLGTSLKQHDFPNVTFYL